MLLRQKICGHKVYVSFSKLFIFGPVCENGRNGKEYENYVRATNTPITQRQPTRQRIIKSISSYRE